MVPCHEMSVRCDSCYYRMLSTCAAEWPRPASGQTEASCQRIDWFRHVSGQCASPPSPTEYASPSQWPRLLGAYPTGPLEITHGHKRQRRRSRKAAGK
jgi:hypothetical protein